LLLQNCEFIELMTNPNGTLLEDMAN